MSYYQALGLVREPFANTPDPDLLYRARPHLECLQHMEIAVRLRRGLNVVLGRVGTGKTTLARELARLLAQDGDIEVHVLDDPYQPTGQAFLETLARLFGLDPGTVGQEAGGLREALKAALVARGETGRIVTLIVDEGQKITGECLELLRELLNVETDAHKLLQIVIFAQTEFEEALAARPNLEDRVNFRYQLKPLDRGQTRRMIEARLARCTPDGLAPPIFTPLALRRIHRLTGGYPRKIVRLCHLSMLLAVGFGKSRIGWGLVGRAARQSRGGAQAWLRPALAAVGLGAAALAGLLACGPFLPEARQAALAVLGRATAALTAPASSPGQAFPAGPEAAREAAPSVPPEMARAAGPAVADPVRTAATETVAAQPAEVSAGQAAMLVAGPTVGLDQAAATPDAVQATGGLAQAGASEPVQTAAQTAALDAAGVEAALAALSPDASEPLIVVAAEEDVAAAPAAVPAVAESARLGACAVRPGWTVSRLAARVYGNGGRSVLARLAKANPGVDFSRVRAGESLVYPAITAKAPPAGSYLVKVEAVASLEQGIAALSRMKDRQGLTLSLFCTGHPDGSLRFDVVLPELFPDKASAQAALAALPQDAAAKAVLVGAFPSGTAYFTDLGDNGPRRPGRAPAPVRQVAERQPLEAAPPVSSVQP